MSSKMDYKNYGSKEKTLIKKEIFWQFQDNQPTWKDIKHIEFQDDDTLIVAYEEDTDNSNNEGWYMSVERWVEETDLQFAKRLKNLEMDRKQLKKRRYESYIKLKAEFENEEHKG